MNRWAFRMLFCFAFTIPCYARTITVDDDGPADFNSIQAAIDDANNYDTIAVAAGTYYENIRIVWKDGINIEGAGADVTTINGGQNGHVVVFNPASGRISGFTITNSGTDPMNSAGIFTSLSVVTIVNNVIIDNANGLSTSGFATVVNNVIANNRGAPFSKSVKIGGGYTRISGNLIVGGKWGIWSTTGSSGVYIIGNTIADHELYGIYCSPCVSDIHNNIIVGNSIGILLQGELEPIVPLVKISHNNVWNNWLYNYLSEWIGECSSGSCTGGGSEPFDPQPGTGEISADPLFADSVSGDYHLLPDSPCIDAGDNNSVPYDTVVDLDGDGNTVERTPWDFDSHPRFVDDPGTIDTGSGLPPIVDIGADEFPYLGDLDFSGFVNFWDYALFAIHWPQLNCGACGGADLTGDSDVGPDDVRVFCENWLAGTEP